MTSLSKGFEYDIFISYRHNDNLDGWVTDFVSSLEKELKSTLKDEVTIYFDKNPHDGLLESHQVNESLKEKLKCVIFIPIISQTYCDPKSFAWGNEFLVFKQLASEDQVGLKLKLKNGNVASRILPVRIHELDDEDTTVLENEIGPIRSIDFIFKSNGVNRPLLNREEHPQDNQSKTFYRDQINKVANASKEIFSAIGHQGSPSKISHYPLAGDRSKYSFFSPRLLTAIGTVGLMLSLAFWLWFSLRQSKLTNDGLKTSVAVIPFKNLNRTAENEVICSSLSEDILTQLASLPDLHVPSPSSSNQYADSKKLAKQIGQELGVRYILEGSILATEDEFRINAILTDTELDEIVWTKPFTRKRSEYFKAQNDVAHSVVTSLHINLRGRSEEFENVRPFDLKAYEMYKIGLHNLENQLTSLPTLNNIVPYFEKALLMDSSLYPAYVGIANSYIMYNTYGRISAAEAYPKIKAALDHGMRLNPNYGPLYSAYAIFAIQFDYDEESFLRYNSKAMELDANNDKIYFNQGLYYLYKQEFKESIEAFVKAGELSPDRKNDYFDWQAVGSYLNRDFVNIARQLEDHVNANTEDERAKWDLGLVYIQLKEYQKAVNILKERTHGTETNWILANAYWALHDTVAYNKVLQYQLQKIERGEYVPPAVIGHIYLARGEKEKACEWINKQIDSKDGGLFWLLMITLDPRLDPLKNQPCYQKLLKKIPRM